MQIFIINTKTDFLERIIKNCALHIKKKKKDCTSRKMDYFHGKEKIIQKKKIIIIKKEKTANWTKPKPYHWNQIPGIHHDLN